MGSQRVRQTWVTKHSPGKFIFQNNFWCVCFFFFFLDNSTWRPARERKEQSFCPGLFACWRGVSSYVYIHSWAFIESTSLPIMGLNRLREKEPLSFIISSEFFFSFCIQAILIVYFRGDSRNKRLSFWRPVPSCLIFVFCVCFIFTNNQYVSGEGNGNWLQYSCWEIPWRGGAGGLQSVGSQKSCTWVSDKSNSDMSLPSTQVLSPPWIIFHSVLNFSFFWFLKHALYGLHNHFLNSSLRWSHTTFSKYLIFYVSISSLLIGLPWWLRWWGFPGGGKEPACQCRRREQRRVRSLGREDPLEEGTAAHTTTLAWTKGRAAWRLQSTGAQRVGHNWGSVSRAHGSSVVKNPPANAGDVGSNPGAGRSPREGNGNPLQHSCLESLLEESGEGYSPWSCKQQNMT